MPVDLVLRAIATLSCMYTAGLFITLTSIAAINVTGFDPTCGPAGCMTASYEQRLDIPIRPAPVRMRALASL